MRFGFTLALSIVPFLCHDALGGVIVVDPHGAITTVSAALEIAQNGDAIVVKSGIYPGFTIVDKAISILAAPEADVVIVSAIGIQNLAAGKTVLLDRLKVNGINTPFVWDGHALWLAANLGRIRLQGCEFRGADGVWNYLDSSCVPGITSHGFDALKVIASMDVIAASCVALGGKGADLYLPPAGGGSGGGGYGGGGGGGESAPCQGQTSTREGGDALDIGAGSRVFLVDSTMVGGDSDDAWVDGLRAGHGVDLRDGVLFVANSFMAGGRGGDVHTPSHSGGAGGSGVAVGVAGTLRRFDSTIEAGSTGLPFGPEPSDVEALGPVVELTGSARTMLVEKSVFAGDSLHFYFHGAPGDLAMLLLSPYCGGAIYAPQFRGTLGVASAAMSGPMVLGVAGPYGLTSVAVPTPELPPGLDAATLWLQGVVGAAEGGAMLTAPSHLMILPSE